MLTILKREFKNSWHTPIGYVFIGTFLLMTGLLFFIYNIFTGVADLSSFFGNMRYVFMMIVPILTMRLISEERRTRVDQLLLTSSCPVSGIVVGKYLAATAILTIGLLTTGIYVGILARYSTVHLPSILCGYAGTWLLGGFYVAVGLFMSSLTEKQVSAGVMTIGVNLLLQLAETYSSQIILPNRFLQRVVSLLSFDRRYSRFVAGLLSFSDAAYFLSFIGMLLVLTTCMVERRRW